MLNDQNGATFYIDIAIEIDHSFSSGSVMPLLCTNVIASSVYWRYRIARYSISILMSSMQIVLVAQHVLNFKPAICKIPWLINKVKKNWHWCSFQYYDWGTAVRYLIFFVMNVLLYQITDNALFITHYVNSILIIMTHYVNHYPLSTPFFCLLMLNLVVNVVRCFYEWSALNNNTKWISNVVTMFFFFWNSTKKTHIVHFDLHFVIWTSSQ